MDELFAFNSVVLLAAAAVLAAVLWRAVAERLPIPAPAVFLVVAAVASDLFPSLFSTDSFTIVAQLAVVALIVILFDGGMHIGRARFRAAALPVLSLGVLGTFATAGLIAAAAHYLLGTSWIVGGLLGAALAPTDPAVVFSVLGNREIEGRTGTILEGESGANDPVGIALMIGMIELATQADATFAVVVEEFVLEMGVGLAVGVAGGLALGALWARTRLSEPPLYPLLVLAASGVVYGAAAAAHGSGFLAVFVAGILIGDLRAPRQPEVEAFHKSLASLAEIAVFVALGLTIDLGFVWDEALWVDGLVLFALLAFVIRPLVVGGLLAPVRLRGGERAFVVWAGLKGAVPILLAALVVLDQVNEAERIYGTVFVVVLVSVVLQGSLVPAAAARLGVPMRSYSYE